MKMTGNGWIKLLSVSGILFFLTAMFGIRHKATDNKQGETSVHHLIKLPAPVYTSATSVEEALLRRRSVREYKNEPISLKDISQLLWAAQGITSEEGGRTAPSAGALYPLEIYLVSGNVTGLAPGVYHYLPADHSLDLIEEGDKRKLLYAGASLQVAVKNAAAVFVITAVYERTTVKYFERGKKYVHMEAGHASQNIYLQAVSLKLGTVAMGAFTDSLVKKILLLPKKEEPLYLMPVGNY